MVTAAHRGACGRVAGMACSDRHPCHIRHGTRGHRLSSSRAGGRPPRRGRPRPPGSVVERRRRSLAEPASPSSAPLQQRGQDACGSSLVDPIGPPRARGAPLALEVGAVGGHRRPQLRDPVARRRHRLEDRRASTPMAPPSDEHLAQVPAGLGGPGPVGLVDHEARRPPRASPALAAWSESPQPGVTTTTVVSAAAATSTSTWPTPTVSTSTTGSRAPRGPAWRRARPAPGRPGGPRVAIERMNTDGSRWRGAACGPGRPGWRRR